MADIRYFLLGAVLMVTTWLAPVHSHECDCSKYTKGGDGCTTYTAAVAQCIMAVSQMPPELDMNLICQLYNQTKGCMDAAAAAAATTCPTLPAESKEWTDKWDELSKSTAPLCSHPPGDTSCANFEGQATACLLAMSKEAGESTDLADICRLMGELRTCMDPLLAKCPDEAQNSATWKMVQQHLQNIPC